MSSTKCFGWPRYCVDQRRERDDENDEAGMQERWFASCNLGPIRSERAVPWLQNVKESELLSGCVDVSKLVDVGKGGVG